MKRALMRMFFMLVLSKLVALRLRMISSIRGWIQPFRLARNGVDTVAGELSFFLGVMLSDGSVIGEGEEAVLPAVVCVTDCDEVDRTSAVEDMIASIQG